MSIMCPHIQMKALSFSRTLPACQTWDLIFSAPIGGMGSSARFREQPPKRQAELIKLDADYGEIVCRCQTITKREIRAAIENPLGVRTLSGIKYRAWSMTGRCQGGYCLPRIAEIMRGEYGIEPEAMRYRGEGSYLFTGKVNL